MITLDTSALLALLNRKDVNHDRAVHVLDDRPGPYLVPMAILAEVAYLIETRHGSRMLRLLLDDLGEGTFSPECGDEDLPRIRSLIERYADLPLGFADAAVAACAERRGGSVLTFDLRHFGVVSREGRIGIVP